MKKCLLLLLLPFTGLSQLSHKQHIASEITEVKLYLTAGQMIHKEKLSLKEGRNRLIFSGISAYADPQSIQFNASGDYRLVSVSTEMDFLAAEQFNPRIATLKDSLELLEDLHQANLDIISAFNMEKALLNQNMDLGGNNQNVSVEEIKEAATFYRTRTLEINKEITRLNKEQREYSTSMEETRFQLVELNYNENMRSNQVVVLLDCPQKMDVESTLKYLVSDCGWAATYDLSAQDLVQKINLKYKAQVYNNTGNEWKGVKLTLSTADPQLSASHPELTPWYLYNTSGYTQTKSGYYAPKRANVGYRNAAVTNINSANERVYDNYYVQGKDEGKVMWENNKFQLGQQKNIGNVPVKMRTIQITELTTEFAIEDRFSCPSDAKPYTVDVKEVDLEANFSHITVPKLDRSAFLIASIDGWQDLELIPGPTNVYFGGVYVGISEIDTRNVSDTLRLSFGRDEKVTVLRKLKKEYSTKKVVGNTKKDSYMYEIAVRNNRSVPIQIEVFDQIPISKTNDISVMVDELSGGDRNEETGEVTWKLNVSSGQVSGKELGYTVKYPKNTNVAVRRYRSVSSAYF